jgi:hypothetical protein
VQSLALLTLREGPTTAPAFGLLVLGSPDPLRFDATMGTEFLARIAELPARPWAACASPPQLTGTTMAATGRLPQGVPAPASLPWRTRCWTPWRASYLEHVRVEKRLAARTLALYTWTGAPEHAGAGRQTPLLQLQPVHIRRFVAQMHGQGRSGRGLR